MSGAADRYLELLAREREAAVRADVEALLAIQGRKAEAVEALRAAPPAPAELERITEQSRANLRLLRHLSECLRAMVGFEEATAAGGYDARGRRPMPAGGGRWAR